MGKLFNVHPSDDQLDRYLVGHLPPEQEQFIEEHYFGCATCIDRLSSIAEFVAVLKAAVVQTDSLACTVVAPRKPARFAAMLLIAAGTALVCDAPAPLLELQPPTFASLSPPKPSAFQQHQRVVVRQLPPSHHSQPLRIFQPPQRRPVALVMAQTLEPPGDLIIPSDWIGEQAPPLLVVQTLEPPPLPPYEAKPRWFRRVIAAVRKGLEPQRW